MLWWIAMMYSFVFIEYKQAGQNERLSYGILSHNDGRFFDRSFMPISDEAAKAITSPMRLLQYILNEEPWKWHEAFSIEGDDKDYVVNAKVNMAVYMNGEIYCYSPR
jgi:hypothetical protein